MNFLQKTQLDGLLLPLLALVVCGLVWQGLAGKSVTTTKVDDWGDTVKVTQRHGISKDLPTPLETWQASKPYLIEPLAKRGELERR